MSIPLADYCACACVRLPQVYLVVRTSPGWIHLKEKRFCRKPAAEQQTLWQYIPYLLSQIWNAQTSIYSPILLNHLKPPYSRQHSCNSPLKITDVSGMCVCLLSVTTSHTNNTSVVKTSYWLWCGRSCRQFPVTAVPVNRFNPETHVKDGKHIQRVGVGVPVCDLMNPWMFVCCYHL